MSIPRLEPLEGRDCPAPVVTYHGGPVLARPNVHSVFYGRGWADRGDRQRDTQRLGWDVLALVQGTYAGGLAPYGVGRGTAADPQVLDAPLNGRGWLDDTVIQDVLRPTTRGAGPDDVWLVFVEPGVAVSVTGAFRSYNSQSDFAGYHSELYDGAAFRPYAVIPWPGAVDGSPYPNLPALGPAFQAEHGLALGTLDNVTVGASHEFAEAVTDPYLTGWFAGTQPGGEVGDLAQGDVYVHAGFEVQAYAGPDGLPVEAP